MAKAWPLYITDVNGSLASNAPLMLHIRLTELYQFSKSVGDPSQIEDLHNMRIAAKRLRYTMEIYASCYPSKIFNKLYDKVKSIQEQIGEIHDCDVRIPLIQSFLESEGEGKPEIKYGITQLISSESSKRDQLYKEFCNYWSKLESNNFKQSFLNMIISTGDVTTEEVNDNSEAIDQIS